MSGQVETPASFSTENPARISLDFVGVRNELDYKTKLIGVGPVLSVTALEAGNRTRVVINLANMLGHEITLNGNEVLTTLDLSSQNQMVAQTLPAARNDMKSAEDRRTPNDGTNTIKGIDFRRGENGQGRVLITLGNTAMPVDVREEGGRILVEFYKSGIDRALLRSLDVVDFATPVSMIETSTSGGNVRVEITATGEYDYLAYQANDIFAVEVRSLTKQEKEMLQKERMVFTGERLSLNFQDIEVRSVLQLLADFTGLNLVTSDTVSGRITLRLKNVPWDQALDIILKSKGLSKR
jgi:type IV pilus assembly protein PilQ